ncbi:MAG: O-acetyl-ADP-ribose deacetylase [Candidatus Bathyarchaeota archaeon]|jgi:O-acetyl-ADP-ribose deacetylase (regulator of RNase III)
MKFEIGKARISIVKGDITDQSTDAIVNAANSSLLGGGGVDGAIHRRGGPKILDECKELRRTRLPQGLPTGKAVITSGGNLKAKWVIHTVGPIWRGGNKGEAELLVNAYRNSLQLATLKDLRTVAFPSISTGAYRYPIEKASKIALKTVESFILKNNKLDEIVFVLFSQSDHQTYINSAQTLSHARSR